MKIRLGFVSNSSSSSFVVLIPENFNIETENLDKYLNNHIDENKDNLESAQGYVVVGKVRGSNLPPPPTLREKVIESFKILTLTGHKNRTIWEGDGDMSSAFYTLVELFEDRGFIIATLNVSSGGGEMVSVDQSKIKKILESK